MIRFLDGPAAYVALACRRAPLFLRVVHNPNRKEPWDALDQLTDKPNAREKVYAYRKVNDRGFVHLKMSPRSASGYYAMADYEVVNPQPADDVLRSTDQWRAWCWQQVKGSDGTQAEA